MHSGFSQKCSIVTGASPKLCVIQSEISSSFNSPGFDNTSPSRCISAKLPAGAILDHRGRYSTSGRDLRPQGGGTGRWGASRGVLLGFELGVRLLCFAFSRRICICPESQRHSGPQEAMKCHAGPSGICGRNTSSQQSIYSGFESQ